MKIDKLADLLELKDYINVDVDHTTVRHYIFGDLPKYDCHCKTLKELQIFFCSSLNIEKKGHNYLQQETFVYLQ